MEGELAAEVTGCSLNSLELSDRMASDATAASAHPKGAHRREIIERKFIHFPIFS
jgi:hypothetical protein